MLTIRSATTEDAYRVTQIYVDSWNDGFPDLMPTAVLDDARVRRWTGELAEPRWWVAEVNGLIAGFTGIGPSRDPIDPDLGELDTIAVDPAYWRRGVGKALMHKALEELAAAYPEAILWTLANYPQRQRFYETTGWTLTDITRANGTQIAYHRRFRDQS